MGLNDENRKSVPIWQFNVARGGCGEYGILRSRKKMVVQKIKKPTSGKE